MTLEEAKALTPGQRVCANMVSGAEFAVVNNTDEELTISLSGLAQHSYPWHFMNDHTVSTWTLVPDRPAPCLVGKNSPTEN